MMGMNVVSMIVCELLTDAASAADHLLDFVATRPSAIKAADTKRQAPKPSFGIELPVNA
jgi:hypothetical protein